MRWLIVVMMLVMFGLGAPPAAARFVGEVEPMAHACPRAKSWALVARCLAKHGQIASLRTAPGARLVRLDQLEGGKLVDGGVLLYVERGRSWRLAGIFHGRGSDYQILELAPLTVGKHTGHRLDIGQARTLRVAVGDGTTVPGLLRTQRARFCGGESHHCSEVVVACEVLVRGKAVWTFRGSVGFDEARIVVSGDRSRAGTICATPERSFLGWPVTRS